MKKKKILAALCAGVMLAATPVVPQVLAQSVVSTAYAAKGGARIAPKAAMPAPKAPAAQAPKSSPSKSVSGNGESYAPSKSAKDLQKDAPATNSKASAGTTRNAAPQSGSRFGNIMRNIGLFAGGMFLGSMLAHLFGGMGTGMLADILGVLMNVVLLVVAICLIRWLWNRFRGNRNNGAQGYASMRQDSRRADPIDITPRQPKIHVQDIQPPTGTSGRDYDPKTMADRYRNR